jgi:hypothetical protein
LGVSVFIQIFLSTWNKTRVYNTKGAFFNYEGVHIIQFVNFIPLIIFPLLIYFPFHFFNFPNFGFIVLSSIGILGILLKNKILQKITFYFEKQKYEMLVGFRKK